LHPTPKTRLLLCFLSGGKCFNAFVQRNNTEHRKLAALMFTGVRMRRVE